MPSQLDVDKIRHTNGTDALTFDTSGNTNLKSAVIEGSSSGNLVRITQTGTGNALVVEDSANPDSTPFVVTSNGNVGIGKEPTTKLEIYNAGYTAAQITGNSTSETQLVFDGNTAARINNKSNTDLLFATNATERMRITSSGNVGIGTSPSAPLDVKAGTDQRFMVRELGTGAVILDAVNAANSAYQTLITNGSVHILRTGGTERMRIDSSGNVGIGTSNPQDALHLSASSPVLRIENTDTSGIGAIEFWDAQGGTSQVALIRYDDFGNQFQIQGNANGTIFLTPGNTFPNTSEAMRVDSNGRLLVGTTSAIGDCLTTKSNSGSDTVHAVQHYSTANTSWYMIRFYNGSGSTSGSITMNTSTLVTAYNTGSDYRLKEDWQPMTGSIDRLKNLNPVNFAWKVDGSRVDGFLAHEAQEVVPEAVTGTKDAVDDEGNPEYQGIDQSKLVPLLTAALQEAIALIESQQSQIDALTAKTQEQDLTIASLISRIEALETN